MELVHTTKLGEISIRIEPFVEGIMGMKIRRNNETLATFDLAAVFDFVMKSLTEVEHPKQFSGLERRCYIASKVSELTDEWLKTIPN